MMPKLPTAVVSYVRNVFRTCNKKMSLQIARVPGVSEPTLDQVLITELTAFAAPCVLDNSWAVRIDTHFLGGRRHFHSWEVADIGLLIQVRKRTELVARKVALLQSKRLYPESSKGVIQDSPDDYLIGMGGLLQTSEHTLPIANHATYSFSSKSKYKSLKASDTQTHAIGGFEDENAMPVHYLLYNPWSVPVTYEVPHLSLPKLTGKQSLGARVVPAKLLLDLIRDKAPNYSPSLSDITSLDVDQTGGYGWTLEYFVADLVLKCRQGTLLDANNHDAAYNLFNRRSGPISAAISVVIEEK
jgi:hypothetical protein